MYTDVKPTFKLVCYRLSSWSRIRRQYHDYYDSFCSFNVGMMLIGLGIVILNFVVVGMSFGIFTGPLGRGVCTVLAWIALVPLYPWHVISRNAEVDELPHL